MFRLRYVTKLLGVMTMSALLLWLPMQPAMSQKEPPQPPTVVIPVIPPRSQTVQQAGNALAALTAAEPLLLDVENIAVVSHTVGNLAWIPLDPREWTEEKRQLLREILSGQPGSVTVGVVAIGDDLAIYSHEMPDSTLTLPKGIYLAKVRWDEDVRKVVAVLVDQDGEIAARAKLVTIEAEDAYLKAPPFIHTKQWRDTNKFLVAVGSEPLSKFLAEIEARVNPIIIVVLITPAAAVKIASTLTAGAVAIACIVKCGR